MKKEDVLAFIEDYCEVSALMVQRNSESSFKIFTGHASGITLILNAEEPTDFSFYFLQRTYDVVYHGDRTDVHVILSLMFACFLRASKPGISCSLFDISHPVVDGEIWGRYIMPEQIPAFFGVSSWEQLQDAVKQLIDVIVLWQQTFWKFALCPCDGCAVKFNISNYRDYQIPEELLGQIKKKLESCDVNYGNRARPGWNYYYDMKNEVTIIKSIELSSYLQSICNLRFHNITNKVDAINGMLIVDDEVRNFIHFKSIRKFKALFKSLNINTKKEDFVLFIMENMVVAVANTFVVALGRLGGIDEFKIERENLRKRHNTESELIFPIPLFEWEDKVCPDQFELLIKALLEREPNVRSVRRPAPINEGDKGRDLMIEWSVLDLTYMSEEHPPTSLIKVVGQCKTSNTTVGKSKVQDIRDTVETHNSTGYFIAVNTQISGQLTEKLEDLQLKGIWTFWWNRDDIEMRLSKNQDLIPWFPKVIRAKQQIKFVDKE